MRALNPIFLALVALAGSLPGAEPPPAAEPPESPAPEPAKQAESWTEGAEEVLYYGKAFSLKRVVFCLDTSNSMQNPVPSGGKYAPRKDGKAPLRRIDLAREELIRTIRELPADTEFAVVFFDGDVCGWPKGRKLKPATGENKKDAIGAIERKELVFGTDIIGALEEAFEYGKYGKVDTIILLTDGAPYTLAKEGKKKDKDDRPPAHGRKDSVRSDPKVILETVGKLNRKRGIKVHTIALGGNCRVDFLKELAAANGGTFLQVEAGQGDEPSE